jgi:hypothetical protein
MATFRGVDGFLAVGGGHLQANAAPKLAQAENAGATTVILNASVSLVGVVMAGDTFTIAGEAGSPVHTVSGGPYLASGNSVGPITFSPQIAAGGVAQNAVVTIAATSIAEARLWTLTSGVDVLETTKFGTAGWKEFRGGLAEWSGTGEAHLDYGDLKQKALIDKLSGANPSDTANAAVFGVLPSATVLKQFYGSMTLTQMQLGANVNDLVRVTFQFRGVGAINIDWTA